VLIDWPADFGNWLDDLDETARRGDHLEDLEAPPTRETETATLKWVRQSKRYPVWRVSHPYREGVAVRLICWFPPDSDTVVVALFAADKAKMGDVFYSSVGGRADAYIEQWQREVNR
jgi:hypothetical protein